MKRFFIFCITLLFFLTSCSNLYNEKTSEICFSLGRKTADEISSYVSKNASVTSESSFDIECSFNGINLPAKTVSVQKKDLQDAVIKLDKIPVDIKFTILIKVIFNSHVIFQGESTPILITDDNPDISKTVIIEKKVAHVEYEPNGGKIIQNAGGERRNNVYFIDSDSTTFCFPDIEKPNYVFDGWYSDKNFAENTYVTTLGKDNFIGDVKLYARWVSNDEILNFMSLEIPKAGISKRGNTVNAKLVGNFPSSGITTDSIKVTCAENPSIVQDYSVSSADASSIVFSLTIPSSPGEYTIKIRSTTNRNSENATVEGKFIVKDYSGYNMGDVLLNDGTKVSNSEITPEQKNKAVAVAACINDNGAILGVGLNNSTSGFKWSTRNIEITQISCDTNGDGEGAANWASCFGDNDGSDNWDGILLGDSEGAADPASNYPAFNYAKNYGSSLPAGYNQGWFFPSLYELCEVYKNKSEVNAGLLASGGNEINYKYVWSSSQRESHADQAWYIDFSNGYMNGSKKSKGNAHNIICLKVF